MGAASRDDGKYDASGLDVPDLGAGCRYVAGVFLGLRGGRGCAAVAGMDDGAGRCAERPKLGCLAGDLGVDLTHERRQSKLTAFVVVGLRSFQRLPHLF